MRKTWKLAALVLLLSVGVYLVSVASDKAKLTESVIRLHVVADSDSEEDQALKLTVRDAVLDRVYALTEGAQSPREALDALQASLGELEAAANAVLEAKGTEDRAKVTLLQESFPIRHYDTFSLPAGVYESLRITIGSGEGQNWWCVVFPQLCVPSAAAQMEDTAAGAGFSDSLTGAIAGRDGYELRFYVMELWGRIENFFRNL